MPKPKVNVLVSFTYFNDTFRAILDKHDPASFRLMVDSGAFTAWSMGKTVDMDDYARFLRSLPSEWEVEAIQLDVIGDHKATLKNFLRMVQMGVDTIPVFTRGTPLKDREKMYAHKDYVALGGLVNNPAYLPFVRYFMRTNEGRRVHWLGYTKPHDLKRYKPTSVDSSAISGAQRYGAINYYRGAGQLNTIQRAAFAQPGNHPRPESNAPRRDAFMTASRRAGFTTGELRRLARAEAWQGDVARSIDAPRGFASFVNFVHGAWHAIDVERNIGTRVYHAMAQPFQMDAVFNGRDFLVERGTLAWATRNERVPA